MEGQIYMYNEPDYECSEQTNEIDVALFNIFCATTMPQVDSENAHLKFKYASLDAYIKTLTPLFIANGIHAIFSKGYLQSSGFETLNLLLKHVKSGQWVRYRSHLVKGNKALNEYQEDGSARTYQKRYLLRDIFFMCDGSDDDTQSIKKSSSEVQEKKGPYVKWITKQDVAHLRSLLLPGMEPAICSKYNIESLYKLPESEYEGLLKILSKK
jgi:ERF superfamily